MHDVTPNTQIHDVTPNTQIHDVTPSTQIHEFNKDDYLLLCADIKVKIVSKLQH